MNTQTKVNKVVEVLKNSKVFMERFNTLNKMNYDLGRITEAEKVEDYVFAWDDGQVILSNEKEVQFEDYVLPDSISKGLNRKGLDYEFYDGGTIMIYEVQ